MDRTGSNHSHWSDPYPERQRWRILSYIDVSFEYLDVCLNWNTHISTKSNEALWEVKGWGWNIGNKKEKWEVTKQEGLKVA